MPPIAEHYTLPGLVDRILAALEAAGKDTSRLTTADLGTVDEFHIRGREATAELVDLAGFRGPMRIVDAGSGLGGPARFLAERGCTVDGVDLTPEFREAATRLSDLVGLGHAASFHCASALQMPFEPSSFDGAITQHVQMNIADKAAFYAEIRRVLKPGATFACHDILAGPGGLPHFPVPWADDESLSWLAAPETLRGLIHDLGFREVHWLDRTGISQQWFQDMLERRAAPGPHPPGVALLLRGDAPLKMANVARNLAEQRITVFMGVFEA